ncbi:hypothetical protein HXX76_005728 [Chlamydomonas incerta]|uniref:Uncharacterized protein n=1 Tax=Chlamydomonas incerta TaxID=51695 RepID=A0A835W5Q6_CHLIN|nr:hypothetical protein HXX76_005728 [Chlamydomonas incerta]|eukprot:KAG2438119.1 hypothetical protein HXX76_005728 [Chlamydomonas incerta]
MLDASTQLSQQLETALQEYRESRSSKKRCASASPGSVQPPPVKLAKVPELELGIITTSAASAKGAEREFGGASTVSLMLQRTAARRAASTPAPMVSGACHRHSDAGARDRNDANHVVSATAGGRSGGSCVDEPRGGSHVGAGSGGTSGGTALVLMRSQPPPPPLALPHQQLPQPLPAATDGILDHSFNIDRSIGVTETDRFNAGAAAASAGAACAVRTAVPLQQCAHQHIAGGCAQPMLQTRNRCRNNNALTIGGSRLEYTSQQAASAADDACGRGLMPPMVVAPAAPPPLLTKARNSSNSGSGDGSRSSNSSFAALAQLCSRDSSSPHFPSSPTTAAPASPPALRSADSSSQELLSSHHPQHPQSLRLAAVAAMATADGLPAVVAAASPLMLQPEWPLQAPENGTRATCCNASSGLGGELASSSSVLFAAAAASAAAQQGSIGDAPAAGASFTHWLRLARARPAAASASAAAAAVDGDGGGCHPPNPPHLPHQQTQPLAYAANVGAAAATRPAKAAASDADTAAALTAGAVPVPVAAPVAAATAAVRHFARNSIEQFDSISFDSVLWQLDETDLDAVLFA